MVKLVNTLVLETKRWRFESFPRQMNFLNILKKQELNFSWNYSVNSKKKIFQSFSYIKNQKKLVSLTEKNIQIFSLLRALKMITKLVIQNNKIYLILSKSDSAALSESFNSIIAFKNIVIASNWTYGQFTNKLSANCENNLLFFNKKKDNQAVVAINGFKFQSILKEVRQSSVPVLNIGFDGKSLNNFESNVPINLSTTTALAQFLIIMNYIVKTTK